MEKINIVEIDYEGQTIPLESHKFEYLPRINERIVLRTSSGDAKVYQVKDIHHTVAEGTTVYVVSDYRSLNSVLQSIVESVV
ncbi:hypothetical protein N7E81_13985 [Reichenbachiella carrageenanivorans]|uniref:Uncharacterized protein n=1 Tax=Reichenbachiella carrageenanivorans TaxID=2979869 RepID=A0ABY6CX42_9BACT|nr:hypothetical protein [Reichenbachiella carrageenanivorans]UXX78467.1 hypothetical protein N7E81_13985 [Reichenbachiella carrageenanivorans]